MSTLAVWFASLVRAFTGWDVSPVAHSPAPLTPAHGWLLPTPATVVARRAMPTFHSCSTAAEARSRS
jgi:hypothetical protein